MFDIEKAIAAWRGPFEHIRALSADDLKELESHLRDEIESHLGEGADPESAFRQAVREIEDVFVIETEYRKVFWRKSRHSGRIAADLRHSGAMLRNYFLVALRGVRRNTGYTFINVLGLSLGIAICVLLFLFIRTEVSYDRFHESSSRIVRVVSVSESRTTDYSAPDLGHVLTQDLPGVEAAIRFRKLDGQVIRRGSGETDLESYSENEFVFADSSFFDVFSFELFRGDPATALLDPHSVVLSASMASKYFPDTDPVGETLLVGDERPFTVTGIVEDPPAVSSIQYQFLASFSTLGVHRTESGMLNSGWGVSAYPTYLLLREGVSSVSIEKSVKDVVLSYTDAPFIAKTQFLLEPLKDVHFSSAGNSLGPSGDRRYVYIFGSIAVLILIIACINYVNLATARALRRAREVGIRKAVGAHRALIARQFLSESLLMSMLAAGFSVMIVYLALPVFSTIVERSIPFSRLGAPDAVAAILGLVALTGLGAGIYPALYLSRFKPAHVLNWAVSGSARGSVLRKALVVIQFAISVFLLVGAVVVQEQLRFIDNKDLGFSKDRVISVVLSGVARQNADLLSERLSSVPGVSRGAVAGGLPGLTSIRFGTRDEEDNLKYAALFPGNAEFLETLGITIIEGRGFSDELDDTSGGERMGGALVNEALVREFGIQDPIGKELPFTPNQNKYRIVGVVRDFHYKTLVERIEPAIIAPVDDYWDSYVVLKLASNDYSDVIRNLETTWKEATHGLPFEYRFLDESFDAFYSGPHRLAGIFNAFSSLAILIACLGLFGLASFTAEQRTREIGIRKVLGARVSGIVSLLMRDFLVLVALGFIAGAPLAWIAMNRWLEGFAYRTEMDAGTYVIAAALTALLALFTVGRQALRAASANPIDAIRGI